MGTPPPHESFPWASAVAIAVAYVLGWVQWHWSYLIPLFWVLVHTERRQLRFCWVELQRHAEARSAARAPGTESLHWALATLRAVWPMFEQGLSAYTQALMDPVLEACKHIYLENGPFLPYVGPRFCHISGFNSPPQGV